MYLLRSGATTPLTLFGYESGISAIQMPSYVKHCKVPALIYLSTVETSYNIKSGKLYLPDNSTEKNKGYTQLKVSHPV